MVDSGFIEKIVASEEFKILDQVVNKPDATVDAALQKVMTITMAASAVHGPNSLQGAGLVDYNVSLALMELVQRLDPIKHGKLVEFISKLQKQTVIDPSTGEPQKIQGNTLWTDLPSFGYTELETWYEFGGEYKDPRDPQMDRKEQQRWANLNAFLAQLSQATDVHYPSPGEEVLFHPLDKSLRALWTMQKALENGDYPPKTLVGTVALRAACLWFIYAADRLWANVQSGRTYPEASGAGPGSEKYAQKGWKGYERERWDIWEQGLQDAKAACTDEREKTLIEDALAHMSRTMQVAGFPTTLK